MERLLCRGILTLGLVLLPLVGCAPKTPLPTISVAYFPQCYAPFRDLQSYEERIERRRAVYVTSGAAAGVAVGAFAGIATAGWHGAVAGGIAGGVLGATAGFTLAKIEEIREEEKRLASYRLLIGDDLANATALEMAALTSLKCYVHEFENIREALTSQRMTRAEFDARYAEIRAGIGELGKLTGDAQTLMAQREIDLRASLQKEISRSQPSAEPLPTVEQRRFQREQTHTRPTRRSSRRPRQSQYEERTTPKSMAMLSADITNLEAEVRQEKAAEERSVGRMNELRAQAERSKSSSNVSTAAPVTHEELVAVYDSYPNKVLQLEAIERQRKASLQIMDEAAAHIGIDRI